jgi:hypothetical protein
MPNAWRHQPTTSYSDLTENFDQMRTIHFPCMPVTSMADATQNFEALGFKLPVLPVHSFKDCDINFLII